MQAESVRLHCTEGSSDKLYFIDLIQAGTGWVVNFAYGRRGRPLNNNTKTPNPVPYAQAKRIFDNLAAEKMGKGYRHYQGGGSATIPQPTTAAASGTAPPAPATRLLPQLLNPIEESRVEQYLIGNDWLMQEKKDGVRLLVRSNASGVTGHNRKGEAVALNPTVEAYVKRVGTGFVLDGELVAETLFVFDLLEVGGSDIRSQAYERRLTALDRLLNGYTGEAIRIVPTARDEETKRTLYGLLKEQNREGVVFKKRTAPYVPGRPNSGGAQLKLKFYSTATAIVSGLNDKRSVRLALFHGGSLIGVGNVTIPANHQIPEVGAKVEVRYLYAYPIPGSLYQPVYLGQRTDVTDAECTTTQLKFKPEGYVEEEES